ncbi:hypothetical protein H0H81_005100 [Sphagnurus paluster]|uniref:Uncharacterized protein n=1 Tax=Sphagnurus paluster TaxID=117069 RepID=A0A9P7KHA2_9AGAR|nr:hypothetical protein H0H81_005100 [Sphagnurus paluster]
MPIHPQPVVDARRGLKYTVNDVLRAWWKLTEDEKLLIDIIIPDRYASPDEDLCPLDPPVDLLGFSRWITDGAKMALMVSLEGSNESLKWLFVEHPEDENSYIVNTPQDGYVKSFPMYIELPAPYPPPLVQQQTPTPQAYVSQPVQVSGIVHQPVPQSPSWANSWVSAPPLGADMAIPAEARYTTPYYLDKSNENLRAGSYPAAEPGPSTSSLPTPPPTQAGSRQSTPQLPLSRSASANQLFMHYIPAGTQGVGQSSTPSPTPSFSPLPPPFDPQCNNATGPSGPVGVKVKRSFSHVPASVEAPPPKRRRTISIISADDIPPTRSVTPVIGLPKPRPLRRQATERAASAYSSFTRTPQAAAATLPGLPAIPQGVAVPSNQQFTFTAPPSVGVPNPVLGVGYGLQYEAQNMLNGQDYLDGLAAMEFANLLSGF